MLYFKISTVLLLRLCLAPVSLAQHPMAMTPDKRVPVPNFHERTGQKPQAEAGRTDSKQAPVSKAASLEA
jgi:hypothetical protein